MMDFVVEYILPVFLVIFLTMTAIIVGFIIHDEINRKIYIEKIINTNYINNEVENVK